jgi:ribosomal protein S6
MQDGHQYTVTFEDGTRVRYRPWSDTNLYAQRGELEMILDGDATPGRVEAMLEKLEQLGIDTRVATAENAEQMYLEKLAYIRKTDKSADYKRLQKSLDDRNVTTTERVQALRGYWQKELGVQDITQLSGYNPLGEYQAGFLDRDAKGGYRHQFRFDITEEELEKQMKGYSLVHDLTNGESMSGFIDLIMENNGAMVSTVEKMRMGVAPGGMSPVADMQTGGASYFFTRIKKQPASDASPALYFKKQMLRRMDAISYDHDAYGKVIDDYVQRNRGASIDDWKRFSQRHGNETIFKYSVTLLDNVEFIVARSDNERREIIQSFTRRGIKKLPDGRKVEDIVHTPQSWSKRKQ